MKFRIPARCGPFPHDLQGKPRFAAVFSATVGHTLARLAEGSQRWAIPWPCIYEFLAIATDPQIHNPPTPVADALEQVRCWLESPSLLLLGEDEGFFPNLSETLLAAQVTGGTRTAIAPAAPLAFRHGLFAFPRLPRYHPPLNCPP